MILSGYVVPRRTPITLRAVASWRVALTSIDISRPFASCVTQAGALVGPDGDGGDRRRHELCEARRPRLDQVVRRSGDVEHRGAVVGDDLVELGRAMKGLVAADHDDLAADVLARVVGRPADADVDDLGLHAARGGVGEGLAGHVARPAAGHREVDVVDDVRRDMKVLERRREPGGPERRGDAIGLGAAGGAARRFGPELRAFGHLCQRPCRRVLRVVAAPASVRVASSARSRTEGVILGVPSIEVGCQSTRHRRPARRAGNRPGHPAAPPRARRATYQRATWCSITPSPSLTGPTPGTDPANVPNGWR